MSIEVSLGRVVLRSESFLRSPKIVSHIMIFSLADSLFSRIFLISSLANSALVMAWLLFVSLRFAWPYWSSKKWKWKIHHALWEGYSAASFASTVRIVSRTAYLGCPKRESRIWRALATLKDSSFKSSCRIYSWILLSSFSSWYSNQSSSARGKLCQMYLWPN